MKNLLKTGLLIIVVLFLFPACSRGGYSESSYRQKAAAYASESSYDYRDYYRDSISLESAGWEEAGFSPEAPAGVDGQTPPVFRDMSNLYGRMTVSENDAAPATGPSSPAATEPAVQSRKLVKRADIRLRVDDPEAAEKPLLELMEKYDAWTASTGVYENSRSYSIRVPSGSYDALLAELVGIGRVLRRTENAEDVTLRYYDLESLLATKVELLATYRGYLARARNIEEIMTVENRIADLQREIERTGTQFRNLANLVDYSTIDVDITGPVSAGSYSAPTLGDKLKELFGSFGNVASSMLVALMGIIIYGIPAVLIFILLFWLLFGKIGLLKKLMILAAGKKAKKTTVE